MSGKHNPTMAGKLRPAIDSVQISSALEDASYGQIHLPSFLSALRIIFSSSIPEQYLQEFAIAFEEADLRRSLPLFRISSCYWYLASLHSYLSCSYRQIGK